MLEIEYADARRVERFLRGLTANVRVQILGHIERLAREWPTTRAVESMRGRPGCFRLRSGDYRVLFQVEASVLLVLSIGNRKDVYRA